jgi:hypothetical protein
LLGLDCGGEFGREGEVLQDRSVSIRRCECFFERTVRETSSSMMLNLAARLTRLSLTNLETFSR